MSYTPTIWNTGDIITAEKLNKMEIGMHSILSDYEPTIWADGDIITPEKLNKLENAIAYVNFDYIKTAWKTGDIITASLLNNMENGLEMASVDKTWEEMNWNDIIIATRTGKYKTFNAGDMKELDLGSEGIVHMQIVGIDVDDLADGSGKAPLTFISKELLKTSHNMNPTRTNNGGWGLAAMRTYLKNTVKPLIPVAVANEIKNVLKYSKSPTNSNAVTTDDVWIPSCREVFGDTIYETIGPIYNDVFFDIDSRKKFKVGDSGNYNWWLRSVESGSSRNFGCVGGGTAATNNANYNNAIALGFCL